MIRLLSIFLVQLKAYLQLGRIGLAPLTASVPILGALTVAQQVSPRQMWGLGLIGLAAHFFGFALNDIIDRHLDRTALIHRNAPLAAGQLSLRHAWLFTLVQIPTAFLLYNVISPGNRLGLGLLCLSIGLSIVYNLWSKWGRLPRFVAELALAGSIGILCLAGRLSLLPPLAWLDIIFVLTLTLLLLLLNSVPSGLKDLKTDAAFGAHSFIISAGCRMVAEDKMTVSKAIQLYSLSLHILVGIGFLLLASLFRPTWFVITLIFILWLYAGLHLKMLLTLDSFSALRRSMPMLNGYYNYAALALFVIDIMPFILQLVYSVCIAGVLLVPWYVSFTMWRRRYYPVNE